MPSNSYGYAAKGNLSGVAEFRVFVDQLAKTPPIYTTTSRRIAGSDILIRRREAAFTEPRDTIGKPHACNTSLSSSLHTT